MIGNIFPVTTFGDVLDTIYRYPFVMSRDVQLARVKFARIATFLP